MTVTAADARAVDQLLGVIRDGGQPRYLLFWGAPAAVGRRGQHPQLQDFLAGTGSRVLVEASPQDRVWGIGLTAGDERAGSPERWPGLNLLGFALMEVRHQLGASR